MQMRPPLRPNVLSSLALINGFDGLFANDEVPPRGAISGPISAICLLLLSSPVKRFVELVSELSIVLRHIAPKGYISRPRLERSFMNNYAEKTVLSNRVPMSSYASQRLYI